MLMYVAGSNDFCEKSRVLIEQMVNDKKALKKNVEEHNAYVLYFHELEFGSLTGCVVGKRPLSPNSDNNSKRSAQSLQTPLFVLRENEAISRCVGFGMFSFPLSVPASSFHYTFTLYRHQSPVYTFAGVYNLGRWAYSLLLPRLGPAVIIY